MSFKGLQLFFSVPTKIVTGSPKSHYTAPACGFQIAKIFSWDFLQMIAPDRATTEDLQRAWN
jgi:hypothetical protein